MKAKTDGKTDNRSTIGGPSHPEGEAANQFTAKLAAVQELAAAMPYNMNKALEHGEVSACQRKGRQWSVPIRQRRAAR